MTTDEDGSLAEAPIYDQLVAEYGDVVTQGRQAIEATEREAADALDWSDLRPARKNPADRTRPEATDGPLKDLPT